MSTVTDWLMVVITFVYVIATFFICYFNNKSVKATREQLAESKKQFEESNRPHVIAGLRVESDIFMCLYIKNIGNDVAENVEIRINQDWLELIKDGFYLEPLKELVSERFMLVPEQEITRAFTHVIVGVGNQWLDVFDEHSVTVSVSYNKKNSTLKYCEKFSYNIKLFRNMFKEKEEHEKEIREISKSLKDLSSASVRIATSTKTIADKIKK